MIWADPRSSCAQGVLKVIHSSPGMKGKTGTRWLHWLQKPKFPSYLLPWREGFGASQWGRGAAGTLGEEPLGSFNVLLVQLPCLIVSKLMCFTFALHSSRQRQEAFHVQELLPMKGHLVVQLHHLLDGATKSMFLTSSY